MPNNPIDISTTYRYCNYRLHLQSQTKLQSQTETAMMRVAKIHKKMKNRCIIDNLLINTRSSNQLTTQISCDFSRPIGDALVADQSTNRRAVYLLSAVLLMGRPVPLAAVFEPVADLGQGESCFLGEGAFLVRSRIPVLLVAFLERLS